MEENKDIYLLLGDLGYGWFDKHREDFPDRVINCKASEQAMMGIAVGLAQEGKLPFVYSITNFLLYRPFEFIRNYIDHEKAKVVLVGSGRDMDYEHDGWSHHSPDAKRIIKVSFPNIKTYFPDKKEEIDLIIKEVLQSDKPSFISLKR